VPGRKQGIDGLPTRLSRVLRRAVAAGGVALMLAACGDLPLVGTLQREAPGALRFSPPDPVIPLNTPLTFTVMGGIPPYSLAPGSVSVTALDDHTWQFPGQLSNGDFPIGVVDWAGKTATSDVRVYAGAGPQLNVTEVTLPVGVAWTFTVVSGGTAPYTWEADGVLKATGSSYSFSSSATGTHVIAVIDSVGVSRVATADVVPSGIGVDPLSIAPTSAVMLPGGSVAYTALGGSGSYSFSASAGAILGSPTANPATYTAPGGTGTYTITLTDAGGGSPVFADATVTASGTLPLITPNSVTVSVVGDTVQFTASGGTAPYSYSLNRPDVGSIDALTGLYTQLAAGPVLVTVSDKDGLTDKATVKWKP
jgi:hypothetical protein